MPPSLLKKRFLHTFEKLKDQQDIFLRSFLHMPLQLALRHKSSDATVVTEAMRDLGNSPVMGQWFLESAYTLLTIETLRNVTLRANLTQRDIAQSVKILQISMDS